MRGGAARLSAYIILVTPMLNELRGILKEEQLFADNLIEHGHEGNSDVWDLFNQSSLAGALINSLLETLPNVQKAREFVSEWVYSKTP
jgi:hypothetical protein